MVNQSVTNANTSNGSSVGAKKISFFTSNPAAKICKGISMATDFMVCSGATMPTIVGCYILYYANIAEYSSEGAFSSDFTGVILTVSAYLLLQSTSTQLKTLSDIPLDAAWKLFEIAESYRKSSLITQTLCSTLWMSVAAKLLGYNSYELATSSIVGGGSLLGISKAAEEAAQYFIKKS